VRVVRDRKYGRTHIMNVTQWGDVPYREKKRTFTRPSGSIIIIIIIIIITIPVITFTHGIYNYTPQRGHVHAVCRAEAVLYLQSALHVMLFRPCNVFCITLALPAVCVQCTIWLLSAVP